MYKWANSAINGDNEEEYELFDVGEDVEHNDVDLVGMRCHHLTEYL